MKLSIVVPWYRSPLSVRPFYEGCLAAVRLMPEFAAVEFVFVEDCGGDGTWAALAALARGDARVKAVHLTRNFGQHAALTAGLDLCSGDYVAVMDCDLQDRPEELPRLWEALQGRFDMVCARRGKRQDKYWKRLSSRCFAALFTFLSGLPYDSEVANYRIMSRKVVDAWRSMRESTRNLPGQLQWLGFSTGYVDVHHGERYAGKSSYSLAKLCRLALDTILAYSDKPLRLFCTLGFLITTVALMGAGWIVLRKLMWGIPITGWASLIVSIWFLGGIIIGGLGIIGVYLGRVYTETKGRPLYVIDERINI